MSDAHHPHFDGLSSLISFAGFTVPARARFVAQFVGSTLFTSLTLGLVAGQTAALLPCGPLVPFLTGSWMGYTWGCVGFWRRAVQKARTCARRYPRVLAHGLRIDFDVEVPKHVTMDGVGGGSVTDGTVTEDEAKDGLEGDVSLEEWIRVGGVGRLSYAILAAQACEDEIAELQRSERQKLIDGYQKD